MPSPQTHTILRLGALVAAIALCATARAQFAPRASLDVALPATAGFKLALESPGAPLAIAADGTHYVLLHQFAPGAKPAEPAREAWVELLAVAADGALKWRHALPIRDKVTSSGLSISSLGVIAASAGDIAVVWSPNDPPEPRAPRSQIATMLRLGTDGTIRKASPIGPPSATRAVNDPAAYYELYVYRATPDNGVLLAGSYGSGPYAWWMGKFNLDGIRLWQAGPGNGFPERVASLERRLDGSWLSLVTEMVPRGSGLDWVIRRYGADGKLLRRTRLVPPVGQEVAVLRDGAVLLAQSEESAARSELVFVDDHGRVRRRVRWPFATTLRLIAAGDGLAAIVRESDAAEAPSYVVRADAQGVVRWRGPAVADVHSVVALPDGRIAGLLRDTADAAALRLVRFTEP